MEVLYLLIPMSVVLVLAILAVFGWALNRGQFDDLEREGRRIFADTDVKVDADQAAAEPMTEESPRAQQCL